MRWHRSWVALLKSFTGSNIQKGNFVKDDDMQLWNALQKSSPSWEEVGTHMECRLFLWSESPTVSPFQLMLRTYGRTSIVKSSAHSLSMFLPFSMLDATASTWSPSDERMLAWKASSLRADWLWLTSTRQRQARAASFTGGARVGRSLANECSVRKG